MNISGAADALDRQFGIPGRAQIVAGQGGLLKVCIESPAASGEIYLHGAHVTSWRPAGAAEALFVSSLSRFAEGRAIRGGVPICFPWFADKSDDPQAPAHGFVRGKTWKLESIERAGDATIVCLSTASDDATRRWWNADFRLVYRATFGRELILELELTNNGPHPVRFEEALHAYFQIGDVASVRLLGLDGAHFLDKTDARRAKTQPGPLAIAAETDSIYLNVPQTVEVVDPILKRRIRVVKENSLTTVIWNPWREKARQLADLGAGEWTRMICVEACNVLPLAVDLAPGRRHTMKAVYAIAADGGTDATAGEPSPPAARADDPRKTTDPDAAIRAPLEKKAAQPTIRKVPPHGGRKTEVKRSDATGLLALSGLSVIVGAVAGLCAVLFRLFLTQADHFRDVLIAWAHGIAWAGGSFAGVLLVAAIGAALTVVAAWLVRRYSPHASGSGIPHVEAVLDEKLPPASFRLVPVKFVGGLLAMGSGLALGREGPCVQMGASLAHIVSRIFRRNWPDCRVLMAVGAGAGLATAFNAPIAGAVFVLEELVRRFETRIAIAALGASAAAIVVARVFLRNAPQFHVGPLAYPSIGSMPIFLALGVFLGFLGVAYNCSIVAALAGADRLKHWPVEVRAAVIGAGVGLLAWFAPAAVGGGESLTQSVLTDGGTLGMLLLLVVLRFGLGPISYAARTPGGLFAPLLVIGAQGGRIFAVACAHWLPVGSPSPTTFAVVGMAAFFTATVRAPLTGMVLIVEMTGGFPLLLPMLGACFIAMMIPALLGNLPIYDSLQERPEEKSPAAKAA